MPLKLFRHLLGRTQSDVLPGMVPNPAGGAAYPVDNWMRLDRFLVLGSEGGSYYAGERELTRENASAVLDCLAEDGQRVVKRVVQISQAGRAPKNDPAIFVLALAASVEDEATRRAALGALRQVCRTGTHLFQFAGAVNAMRGWGRALRRAVADWYLDRPVDSLAYQAVKYRQREGWTHRDLLRLAHPKAGEGDEARGVLFDWICGREADLSALPAIVRAAEEVKTLETPDAVAALIREAGLPREAVPTEWMQERAVWDAMLADMPMTAMIRTLNRMTAVGLIAPMSDAARYVGSRISDPVALEKARIHPLALLIAHATYASGRGLRGSLTWEPVRDVVDALDEAFYKAFEVVEPSGNRILQALDVSGSMMAPIAGTPLSAREASAAMALVTLATEPEVHTIGFTSAGGDEWKAPQSARFSGWTNSVSTLPISPKQRLSDVVDTVSGLPFGGTDCALPMLYAMERGLKVDAFVVYTDSETWAGDIHPSEALRQYREKTGIPAKLVVVGMVANNFSIADPDDAGMLDVVGFDTATPAVIADFLRGE
tara:strand:- start:15046 stop:16680 length:1635 start_codon:yes stop_codon:yes gene_type:complete